MNEITAVCQECGKQFEYVLKPGFPRKYCFDCSEKKKASYDDMQKPEVVKPGLTQVAHEKAHANGNGSMYASYAKDVFCAMIENKKDVPYLDAMNKSIELVKHAKEAFE